MDLREILTKIDHWENRQSLTESHHGDTQDHEVSMAHSDVYNLAKNSQQLYHRLQQVSEAQGLPGWVAEKITLANDYIEAVLQYYQEQQDSEMFTETASAGASSAGGVATTATGFASGGIGEIRRIPAGSQKKPRRSKHRI